MPPASFALAAEAEGNHLLGCHWTGCWVLGSHKMYGSSGRKHACPCPCRFVRLMLLSRLQLAILLFGWCRRNVAKVQR